MWLHHLDLTTNYGRVVTTSLEVDRYDMGPLLGYFLALGMSGLTFEEESQRALQENRREVEESLMDLWLCREELHQEIELFTQSRDQEVDKERKKTFKRRLNQRKKDLQKLEEVLSQQEHLMGVRGEHSLVGDELHPEQGPDTIVETIMMEAAQDTGTPLSSDVQGAAAVPPEEETEWTMDVDDPQSPITASDDAILSSTRDMGVKGEMATLRVTSIPERCRDNEGEASI